MAVYLASLKITEGSFAAGFRVNLQISQPGCPSELEFYSQLPPAPHIPLHYNLWQKAYLGLGANSRLESNKAFVSNYSRSDNCDRAAAKLLASLNNWLDANSFRNLKERFLAKLNPADEIRILIQTENIQLQCLPWHLVDWFEPYTKAEIAIGKANYEIGAAQKRRLNAQVRILAIMGNSLGIDLECDRQILAQLPNSSTVCLNKPTRQEITERLWDTQGWEILFFAGHSNSDRSKQTGCLQIDATDLTIEELKYGLAKAVERGLQIAIFNSCDGLGLASELAELKIPQIIVMREPVPDLVAQEFLKYFLQAYAGGEGFYSAVREARAKLQGLEDRFPCATWLPVIVQNPGSDPPSWHQLFQPDRATFDPPATPRIDRALVLVCSLLSTIAAMGIRTLGLLHGWELSAFDYLSNRLPEETGDSRILIVGADDTDISASKYGYPIGDRTLNQLVERLQQYEPAVIGIDIFRDFPQPSGSNNDPKFSRYWQEPNVIGICLGNSLDYNVAPPPSSPIEQVGYDDLFNDLEIAHNRDDNVRRYILSRSDNPLTQASLCPTNYSFALQVAANYLLDRDIPITTTEDNNWQLGSVTIPRLIEGNAGYQKFDDRGNQLLISYRRTPQLAQQVTVRDILEERETFDPSWIEDRIVLIGVTAKSVPDVHDTALGKIRGLYLHGHVISQLIAAVEDNRPLIWYLPWWGDWLFVGLCSVASGIIISRGQNQWARNGLTVGSTIFVSGICWLVLTQGGWLAWVPSLMAIAFTSSGIWICQARSAIVGSKR